MRAVVFVLLAVASASAFAPQPSASLRVLRSLRNQNGAQRTQAEDRDSCVPWKTFRRYCNECFCGPSGLKKDARCQRNGCPPGVWNEDGTRVSETTPKAVTSPPDMPNRAPEVTTVPPAVTDSPLIAELKRIKCTPGTTFNHYCNTCTCAPSGRVWDSRCTRLTCERGVWNKDGSLVSVTTAAPQVTTSTKKPEVDPEDKCEPFTTFNWYCNVCFCEPEGRISNSLCSSNHCVPGDWAKNGTMIRDSLAAELEAMRPKPVDVTEAPEVTTTPPPPKNPESFMDKELETDTCIPFQSFQYYCKSCDCLASGLVRDALCTRMPCIPGEWHKNGTRVEDSVPEVTSQRPKVTTTPPPPKNPESFMDEELETDTCVPFENFQYYCKFCDCPASGLVRDALCTRMPCTPGEWYKNGTRVEDSVPEVTAKPPAVTTPRPQIPVFGGGALFDPDTVALMQERCVPGKNFNYYCKFCECPPSGLVSEASCTRMECEPGVWNKNGTRKKPEEEACQPWTTFRSYCKECFCGPDGLVSKARCEQKYCAPGLWDEYGTKTQEFDNINMEEIEVDMIPRPKTH